MSLCPALASMGTIAALEVISRRRGFATTYHKVIKVSRGAETIPRPTSLLISASERQDLVIWSDGEARQTIFGNGGHPQRHVSFGEFWGLSGSQGLTLYLS